jgi:tetratricopeptide (TPR) repeat protein
VSALDPVDGCVDPEAQSGSSVPAEGPKREALLAIERQLADAEALYRAGRYEDGRGVAKAAVAAASDLGHGPSEARASLTLGRAELGAGDAAAAESRLVEAWVAAERVADHQHATRALVELIRVIGYDQARPDEAQRYIDLAEAKLFQRDLGDATRALLLRNKATVRWRQGRYDEALPLLEESHRLSERALGVDHPRVLEVQGSIGAMYAATGQVERSREILEAILPRLQDLLGPEHPTVAALHQNLGATLDSVGDHTRSTEHYRRAVAIFESTLGPEHPSMGAAVSNLGTASFYGGRIEEAAEHYTRALKIKEAAFGPDHVSVAVTVNNLGAVTSELGDQERALELHERALEIRKKALGTDHPEVGQSETNIGVVLHALGRDREALSHLDRALKLFEKLGSRDIIFVEPLRARGETLLGLGRHREAIADLERSVRLARETGVKEFERADSELALAHALARRDPVRARELALSARDLYAAAPGRGKKVEKVRKWLENHKP